MKPIVFVLCGPTASGKTELALKLAKEVPIEIVNADALQIFREMNIGTGKPTEEELREIPYHLINLLNPDEEFSAALYSGFAREKVNQLIERKKIPLLVGGSGFYLRAFEHPPQTSPTE